jgi:hypothetical protein
MEEGHGVNFEGIVIILLPNRTKGLVEIMNIGLSGRDSTIAFVSADFQFC